MKIKFPEAIDLQVYEAIEEQNEIGEITNTWELIGNIKAEIQPLTTNAKRGIMGITETSTHKLFSSDNLKANQKLLTPDGVFFLVQYVQDWKSHKEAVLEWQP